MTERLRFFICMVCIYIRTCHKKTMIYVDILSLLLLVNNTLKENMFAKIFYVTHNLFAISGGFNHVNKCVHFFRFIFCDLHCKNTYITM